MFPTEVEKQSPKEEDIKFVEHIIDDVTAEGYPGTIGNSCNGQIPQIIQKKSLLHLRASNDTNPIGGKTTILSIELRKNDQTGQGRNTLLAAFPAKRDNNGKPPCTELTTTELQIDSNGLQTYHSIFFDKLPIGPLPAQLKLIINVEMYTNYQTGNAATLSVSEQMQQAGTNNQVLPKEGILEQPVFTKKTGTYSYIITVYRNNAPEVQTHNSGILSPYNNRVLTTGVSNHPDYISKPY